MKTTLILAATLMLPLIATSMATAAEKTPLIPVEDFFRLPEKARYSLSPDGTHYAWLEPWNKRLNVMTAPVDGSEEPRRLTSATERDIRAYGWIDNNRLIYAQDKGGDENYHLYLVPLAGGEVRDLTPYDGVTCGLLDELEDDPKHILITMNKENKEIFDVYRADVETGELVMAAKNQGNVTGWDTDHDGQLRLAHVTDGLTSQILYRDDEQSEFRPIFTTDFKDEVSVAGFTADNKELYLLSNLGRNFTALYQYNPANGKQTLLYERNDRDVTGIIWSRLRRKLLGVTWYTEKSGRHYFDEEASVFYESMQARFPGLKASVSDLSKDETRMIVAVGSDLVPGRVYFYDKNQPDQDYKLLVDLYPWLNADYLSEMKPVSYTSRDGLTIHGYLTLPRGVEAKNLPVVINPHGGPESRDAWGYNPEVQLLANRGMAVLQMNYRVSTGYGKEFWQAGFKQWGQKQQDDITDGVKWLIKEGIADPKRIAIYGASYGGYATLMGLIETPELYAAGVDYVGVSNLFTLFDSIPPYWEPVRKIMYETIGNPETDKAMLEQYSPVYQAHRIKAPLFIAQGANDPRVVKDQSDQMVDAMRKRGVEVQYMVKNNEGHGFANEENRLEFYRAMITFLNDQLNTGKTE